MFHTNEPATPLTPSDVEELRTEGLYELVVDLDGALYCDEDLYQCQSCGLRTAHKGDLDEDGDCEDCAREAVEEREHLRQLRADYRASVL